MIENIMALILAVAVATLLLWPFLGKDGHIRAITFLLIGICPTVIYGLLLAPILETSLMSDTLFMPPTIWLIGMWLACVWQRVKEEKEKQDETPHTHP